MSAILAFQFYYTPVLVFTGVLGNVFTVFVLHQTKLKSLPSSCYLAVLALNDNLFLFCLLLVWLKMVGVDMFNRYFFCQAIVYLTSVCSFLNIWLVVSFTFERYVAIKYPLSLQSTCTKTRARIVIGCLTIASLVIYSPLAFFSRPMPLGNTSTTVCTVNPKWSRAANVFNSIDFGIAYILPGTIIAFLNVSIVKALTKLSVLRKTMLSGSKFVEHRYPRNVELVIGKDQEEQIHQY
nr:unnamed protein product [Callosobruchus analis]